MTEPRSTKREQLLDELKRHHETIQEYGFIADQQRRGNQAPWNVTSGQVFFEDEKGEPQITAAPKIVDERVEAVEHAQQRVPHILEDLGPLTSDEELKLRHMAQKIESFLDFELKPGGGPDPENSPNRYEKIDELQNSHRKAWFSFQYAEAKNEKRLEDRDAFDWLEENGIEPTEAGSELTDYELPAYDTWVRYLRKARKALGEQKYTPRHALRKDRRGTKSLGQQGTGKVSGSIVRSDEIDRQHSTEDDGD